ncbi:Mu-like prophage major head subunit gpT family protein [Rhizobium sp. CFBP 8762]|uniref:Mu-like prophage major head subunit gpT family protein n=1 Tax=Rhizobium sp. CFBP 8762 TaxID=2775279 RepID=UPI00177EAB5F|nr:Mu-like prophage major head subunit gpT family protein [Rhizobium sp. CFBP 8762]MBD8554913.1 Mu-like prophage major head subunit gpT family protein [Rhizobium sp. CFBP 8762]
MDINSSTLRGIYTGLSTAFNVRLASTQTYYNTVAMTVSSTTAMNEYPRLDDLPGIREWVGERLVHRLSAQTYEIRNREFEKTIAVKRAQIEDDQIGIFSPVASQIGQDAAEFPDRLVFPLLKKGNVTACYDGQYFFDTDHPGFNEAGSTVSVSNFTPGNGPAWYLIDDTQVLKPIVYQTRKPFKLVSFQDEKDESVWRRGEFEWGVDGRCNAGFGMWQLAHMSKAALTPDNYAAARTAMSTIRKRDGAAINIRPTKLLVPPALAGIARTIVNAELVGGGNTNIWAKSAEVVEIPYLA